MRNRVVAVNPHNIYYTRQVFSDKPSGFRTLLTYMPVPCTRYSLKTTADYIDAKSKKKSSSRIPLRLTELILSRRVCTRGDFRKRGRRRRRRILLLGFGFLDFCVSLLSVQYVYIYVARWVRDKRCEKREQKILCFFILKFVYEKIVFYYICIKNKFLPVILYSIFMNFDFVRTFNNNTIYIL